MRVFSRSRAVRLIFARALRCVVAFAIAAGPALAHDYTLGKLHVDHPYSRPTPPGATTGGVYFTMRNEGTGPDRLVRVASSDAATADLHSMKMDGNVMRMRAVSGIGIPAGATVTLGSGAYHVMLTGLRAPLKVGDRIPLTLTFEHAGTLDVVANVEAP